MEPVTTIAVATAVYKLAPAAKTLIMRLLGPATDELALMLRDPIAARRKANLERIAIKAAAKIGTENRRAPKLSTKVIVSLLEGASLEDKNSGLEEKWAGLLASAAVGIPVSSSYAKILAELNPQDALVLDKIETLSASANMNHLTTVMAVSTANGIVGEKLKEIVDNLLRLRLCMIAVPQAGQTLHHHHLALTEASILELTVLGKNFLTACHGPAPQSGRRRGSDTKRPRKK